MDFAEADFNGDGNLDAIMADYSANYFTLYMGNGNGAFTRSTLPAPSGIIGMDAADFNNDGKMDFVAASAAGKGAYIYLGNGDGTFLTPIQLSYGLSTYVSAGDFNKDGYADLIFGTNFYPGKGDGTFDTTKVVPLGFSNVYAMAEADINGDGNLDLLYTDVTYNRYTAIYTSSLFYRPGNGDGRFGAANTVFTGSKLQLYGVAATQAPSLSSSEIQFNEGEVIQFTATSQDPGLLDTLTFQWNWGDSTSSSISVPGDSTFTRTVNTSHAYGHGGDYTASLTVTDKDGGISNIATVLINILNVAPTVEAGNDVTVDEGQLVTLLGSHTDPGKHLGETYTFAWEVIDSNNTVVASSTSSDLQFVPADNGVYTAIFTVTDDEGASAGDSALITANNVAPIVDAGADQTVDEGSPVTFRGAFTDPGADSWIGTADYGDGTGVQPLTLNPDKTFNLVHSYLDSGSYMVTVSVQDNDAAVGSDSLTVTVNNVAPTATIDQNNPVDEGSPVTVSLVNPSDPSTVDTAAGFHYSFALTPATLASTYADAGTDTSKSFIFDDNATYSVYARICDKDGGYTDYQTSVMVNNVAPVVNAGSDATIDEGGVFAGTGSFIDPGADTWTATVDYGDGTGLQPLALNPDKTFGLGHLYADNGIYTVTVGVTDDDGGVGSDLAVVTVNNVAPQLQNVAVTSSINENGIATLTGIVIDPGILDTFILDVNWGDLLSPNNVETYTFAASALGSQPFTLTHKYLDDNPSGTASDTYAIGLTITDDDRGTASSSAAVTVNNVAPVITNLTNSAQNVGDARGGS